MSLFKRLVGHFMTISRHKLKVTRMCFKCGLYKQGILHDLQKYSPREFISGVKYYQGFRSPIEAEKSALGYSLGWLHHKGSSKHHWEYWIEVENGKFIVCNMPDNYIIEMFCDRVAACKVYQKEKYTESSALEYFLQGDHRYIMGTNNSKRLQFLLEYLNTHTEQQTVKYIKEIVSSREGIVCS